MARLKLQQRKDIIHVLGYTHTEQLNTKEIIKDIETKKGNSKHIIATDPDTQQIAIKLSEDIWLYSEYDEFMSKVNDRVLFKTEVMDMSDYTQEDLEEGVSAYANTLKEHKETYKDDWKQIALEFIFEQLEHFNDNYYLSVKKR